MTQLPVANSPAQSIAWSEIARLCRRICLLREQGLAAEAEDLRIGSLAEMVAALQSPSNTEEVLAARVASIFADETERVANAASLAELLGPLLAAQLLPPASPRAAPPASEAAAGRTGRVPPPRAGAGNIADFIDEMLAQETSVSRAQMPRPAS